MTVHTARGGDIWSVAADKSHAAKPLPAEPYSERDARVSPDGRWIAYVSDESGRPEVSVRTLVGSARRIVLSPDGGNQPVWRKDGGELFFVDPEGRLRGLPASRTNTPDSKFGLAGAPSDSSDRVRTLGNPVPTCRRTVAASISCSAIGMHRRAPSPSFSVGDPR